MKTVLCNNHLCGKEYSIKFDNCPFCGTPNPINEADRKAIIINDEEAEKDNGAEENSQFNVIVIGLIWISIFFFGIRGIITSFANMMFAPGIGCLTLALSIVGLVSLVFILRAKKWALFMWIAYRIAAGIVNGFINSKFDFATNIFIAIANIGLMLLVLQIKKNGVSAWSLIFKKDKSFTNNSNSAANEGAFANFTTTQQFGNRNIEAHNTNEESVSTQDINNEVCDMEESHHIKCDEVEQTNEISTTETVFHTLKEGEHDERTIDQNEKDEQNKYAQDVNDNNNKWVYWIIIGLVISVVALGIWFLAKPNTGKSSTEQIDPLSTEVFDCGLFSFEYPRTFKTTPIQNAPHMVLKLESEDYFMSASYWDYDIDKNVSIWDDEIYEYYRQLPINDGEIVDISKGSIKIKNGLRHCLRIMSNCHKYINGAIVQMKMLSYLMIQNGYLLNFTFGSEGEYIKGSPTTYPDNIMCGLYLKTNEEKTYAEAFKNVKSYKSDSKEAIQKSTIDQNVHDEIASIVQSNNEDLPEYLGFGMTMMRCVLENRSIIYVIQWKGMNPSDFTNEDVAELKDALVEGLMEEKQESAVSKAMINTMKKYGYNFEYRYVNESGKRLCSIRISPSEI